MIFAMNFIKAHKNGLDSRKVELQDSIWKHYKKSHKPSTIVI